MNPNQPGQPPAWMAYFAVADTEGTTKAATDAGAQVFVPPTPIPTVGTFAVLADPQGRGVRAAAGREPGLPRTDREYPLDSDGRMRQDGPSDTGGNRASHPDPGLARARRARRRRRARPNSRPRRHGLLRHQY